MIQIIKLSNTFYAKEIEIDIYSQREDIKTFLSEGTPVILCNDLSDLEELGIDISEVHFVKEEEEEE